MNQARLMVTGGRDFADMGLVHAALSLVIPARHVAIVIHGAAPGADTLVEQWCHHNGFPVASVVAQWGKHGKAAGVLRNGWMVDLLQPHTVLAFPGGAGTANAVARARKQGIPVLEAARIVQNPKLLDLQCSMREFPLCTDEHCPVGLAVGAHPTDAELHPTEGLVPPF